jgi:hypothetical protein
VAALIKQAVGIQPELVVGKRGEFTVWLDDELVARKEQSDDEIVTAVRSARSPQA